MKIKVNERVMIDRCPFTVTRCRVGRASVRLGVVPENASARALLGALHHALPREVMLCMADGAEHTMCVTGVSVQGVVGEKLYRPVLAEGRFRVKRLRMPAKGSFDRERTERAFLPRMLQREWYGMASEQIENGEIFGKVDGAAGQEEEASACL